MDKDGNVVESLGAGVKGWFHVCKACRYEWTGSSQRETCPGCGEGCFSMLDEEMAEACRRKAETNKLPEKLLNGLDHEGHEEREE